MNIEVLRTEYGEIQPMRELYRHEAHCQIIGDSLISRGLADPYLIRIDGRTAGYGAVRVNIDPGYLKEFYTLPCFRALARPMFRELLAVSQVTHIEAQTNIPLSLTMLFDFGQNIVEESVLFEDALTTGLISSNVIFRPKKPGDKTITEREPDGEWVLEVDGAVVAYGGFLCHYNPPYGDIYMEVAEPMRRCGYGSYIVQELKRVCYEAGKKPAARCNPLNVASRRTLEKAGFLPCGRLLVGEVTMPTPESTCF